MSVLPKTDSSGISFFPSCGRKLSANDQSCDNYPLRINNDSVIMSWLQIITNNSEIPLHRSWFQIILHVRKLGVVSFSPSPALHCSKASKLVSRVAWKERKKRQKSWLTCLTGSTNERGRWPALITWRARHKDAYWFSRFQSLL